MEPGGDARPQSAVACRGSLLGAVFEALESAGAAWVVLRGDTESLERGGDIDLLIEPGAVSRVEAVLRPLGFAPVPSARMGSHRFFLGYDEDECLWVRLDLIDHVDFGDHQEVRTTTAPDLLAGRVPAADHYRLCANDAFWHRLLNRLLSSRDIPTDELTRLVETAKAAGPLADLIDRSSPGTTSSAELLDLVRRREWQKLAALRPVLLRSWRRSRSRMPFIPVVRNAGDRARHALRRVMRPTGITVAIIGPDGAGKTTLAEGLRTTLPFSTATAYMGVWRDYPWDRWLRYLPGARLTLRIVRLLGRSAQARLRRIRGQVVLLDRFTYDALGSRQELDRRGRITVALVRRVGAAPQLVLVLDAPPEVMFARKGEQGVERLKRHRLSALAVADMRSDTTVIDATQPVEAVREEAQRAIWARLRRHWTALS